MANLKNKLNQLADKTKQAAEQKSKTTTTTKKSSGAGAAVSNITQAAQAAVQNKQQGSQGVTQASINRMEKAAQQNPNQTIAERQKAIRSGQKVTASPTQTAKPTITAGRESTTPLSKSAGSKGNTAAATWENGKGPNTKAALAAQAEKANQQRKANLSRLGKDSTIGRDLGYTSDRNLTAVSITPAQQLNSLATRINDNEQQLINWGRRLSVLKAKANRGDEGAVASYNLLADKYNAAFEDYVSDIGAYNKLYNGAYRDSSVRGKYASREYMQQRQANRDLGARRSYQQRLNEEEARAPQETTLRRKGASVGEHSYQRITGEGPQEAGYTFTYEPTRLQQWGRAIHNSYVGNMKAAAGAFYRNSIPEGGSVSGMNSEIGVNDQTKAAMQYWSNELLSSGREQSNLGTYQTKLASQGLGTFGTFIVDASIAGVQMLMDMGISVVTGGSMLPAMFVRSMGGGYLTAEQMGASDEEALAYGIGVGAVEALSEKMFSVFSIGNRFAKGAVNKEMSERIIDRLVKHMATTPEGKTALSRLFTLLFATGSEGLEEVAAGIMEPVIRKFTMDPELDISSEIDWQEALYEGLIGSLLGGIGGAVDLPNTRGTYWKYYKEGLDEGIQRYEEAVRKHGLESKEAMKAAKEIWTAGNENLNAVVGTRDGRPVTIHQLAAAEAATRYGRADAEGNQVQGPRLADSLNLNNYLEREENARKEAENQRLEAARTIDQAQPGQGGEFPGSTNGISPSSPQGELTETSRDSASDEGIVRLDTARSAQTRAQAPEGVAESLSGIPEEEMTQEEKDELQYGSGAVEDLGKYSGLAQRMGQPLARTGQGGEFSAAQKTSQGANVAPGTQKVDNMMARLQRQGALKGFNRADEIDNKAKGVFHVNSVSIEILRELTGLPEEVANAAHEAGHLARYYDPELLQDVLDLMRSRGTDIDALVARKALQYQQRFEKAGVKWDPEEYDRDYFEEEVMAEFIGNICKADARYLDMIAAEKPSLLRRLINFFRRLVYEATGDQRAVFEKTIERMNAALEKAGEAKGGGGDRYTFGGENAVNADLDALGRAVDMDAAGTEMRDIFRETGWFKGADGKWRFEIDDSKMKYRHQGDLNYMSDPEYREYLDLWDKVVAAFEPAEEEDIKRFYELDPRYGGVARITVYRLREGGAVLSDIIEHEELFENYPQLRNAGIRFDKLDEGTLGIYNAIGNSIILDNSLRDAPEDTLVHEIQHALQDIEGFAKGASPEYWTRKLQQASVDMQTARQAFWQDPRVLDLNHQVESGELDEEMYDETLDQLKEDNPDLKEKWERYQQLEKINNDLHYAGNSSFDLYRNTAGEIEARDVTARRKMSEEQRRNTMPDTGNEDTVFAEGAEEAGSIINIEGEKGDYGRGVLLDTKMFDPHSPHIWGRVLQDYMYHIMAGKKLTMYDADGNPETVMIARANDRVRADGAKSDRKVLDKLARTTGDNIRTLAIIQLPELAEASGNETYSDKSTHKWLDEHGWRYRTVYLQDRDGNIYTAVLNIADGRDRLILYDVNNIRKIDKAKTPPAGVVSSAVSGGTRTEPSDVFKKSIAHGEEAVKPEDSSRYSFEEDVDQAVADEMMSSDLRKIMQELSAQVSRLTDRLDGKTPDSVGPQGAPGPVAEQKAVAEPKKSTQYNNTVALEDVGVTYDAETESVAPSDRFNLTTWNGSEYVQDAAKAAKELSQALGISEKKARKYIDDINSIAKMIADDKARLDFDAAEGLSSFVSNAEYGGSFDFSTLCKKRRLFTGTFTAIQSKLKNTALTPIDVLNLRKMMKDAGLEVPCGLCYVEGSRAGMGKFSQEFIRLYKKYNPDAKWVPTMKDVNTPDGVEVMRTEHPEVYKEYERFWNNHGKLRDGDPNLFASQQKPKLYMARSAYNGEVLKNFSKGDKVIDKNENGGLRIQSFSDFEIANMLDMMQVLTDMSRVGLAGQAYTKVPEFARAFGATGLKINLSLIAKDVDADGKLIFDDVEGMPFATAMEIRSQYSKNVGTILVVFDDAQLKAAMADERIDFIIPFHRSQWKKEQYEALGLPATTKDYTDQQSEKWFEKRYHESTKEPGKMVETKITPIMSKTYWDYSKTGKENAEEYLRLCKEDGRRPVFYKLLVDNGDGSYSLQPDGSTDGYWKTLIDFKMYDNEGNGAPQLPVRPDFSMDEITRILNEYEGGHNSFPVADKIVGKFVREYKKEHKGDRFSFGEDSFMDEEYMAAVEAGDMDRTQQLVNQAAEIQMQESQARGEDGKLLPVYHGTKADFNKFGREFIGSTGRMEGSGFNFTPSRDRAASYGGNVLRGFLNIEHPLSAEKKTMSVRELADIIRKIDPTGDNIIANYARDTRDYGSDSFIRRESLVTARAIHDYSDNDVDIYSELSAVNPDSDSLIEYFSQAGYDGLIHYDDSGKIKTLIAFNSNQFKRSDPITYDDDGNVIPLSERFNTKEDDMRFSFGEEEEGTEAEAPKDLGSMEPSERSKELIATAAKAKQKSREAEKILRSLRLTPKENALANDILAGTLTVNEMRRGIYDQPVDKSKVERAYEAKKEARDAAAPVNEYNKKRREGLENDAEELTRDSDNWKDFKNKFFYSRETARRIFYGLTKVEAEAKALIAYYIDPIREHEAQKNRMVSRYNDRIKALNIDTRVRSGNKVSEAYAVQYVGEMEFIMDWLEQLPEGETRGGVTYGEAKMLMHEFWAENPNLDKEHIHAAVAEFRSIYDEIFAMINEARVLNGYAPIDYRKGYFPHFTSDQGDSIIQSLANGIGLGVEVTELPTSIAGTTHLFRPGIQWSGHMLQRTGNSTDYNVLEGWDRYIPAVANIIYHTEDIQQLRTLERVLRAKYSDTTVRDAIEKTRNSTEMTAEEKYEELDKLFNRDVTQLNYFVQWLREYTNQLAGKKAELDRTVESEIGRKIYRAIQKVENRVAANMLGGNLSSAMTNFVPLFQAWGNVRTASMMRAMWDTAIGAIRRDGFRDGSDFLINRRGYDAMYQTLFGKTKNALFMPFNIIDDFVSETIVRARYYDELRAGADPMAAMWTADEFAGSVMADRAVGELPIIFNSKNPFVKVFTMFQVEVNNDISHLTKDIPREAKKKGAAALFISLLKYMLGVYMFNDLFEWLFGRRVSLDPLSMLNDLVGDATGHELPNMFESAVLIAKGEWDGWEEFENGKGGNFLSDLVTDMREWADDVPFISGLLGGGRFPIQMMWPEEGSFKPAWEAFVDILKSEQDQENTNDYDLAKLYKFAKNPLWYGAMPAFGGQARKIAEGYRAYTQHGSYSQTKQGKVLQYPILDYRDMVKAMVFGKTTTRYGKEWVKNDFDSLTVPQTEAYINLVAGGSDPQMIYEILHDLNGTDRTAVEKAYALATAKLADGERIMLFSALDRDKEAQNFADLMAAGLSFRQCADVLDEYRRLKDLEDQTAKGDEGTAERRRLSTEFSIFLADQGFDDKTVSAVQEVYDMQVKPIRYDWLTAAGIHREGAMELALDWSELEPLGNSSKVTDNQKIMVVADAGYLSENERHMAIRTLLTDDQVSKYNQYIVGYQIPVETYGNYIELSYDLKADDLDGDGKGDAYSLAKKKFAVIDRLPLQPGQKTALAIYASGNAESTVRKYAPWLQ